jgi:hypothetical protein
MKNSITPGRSHEDAERSGIHRQAEKTRVTLNPIPGTTLQNMIEGLSMPVALKEKLKPILAPKG